MSTVPTPDDNHATIKEYLSSPRAKLTLAEGRLGMKKVSFLGSQAPDPGVTAILHQDAKAVLTKLKGHVTAGGATAGLKELQGKLDNYVQALKKIDPKAHEATIWQLELERDVALAEHALRNLEADPSDANIGLMQECSNRVVRKLASCRSRDDAMLWKDIDSINDRAVACIFRAGKREIDREAGEVARYVDGRIPGLIVRNGGLRAYHESYPEDKQARIDLRSRLYHNLEEVLNRLETNGYNSIDAGVATDYREAISYSTNWHRVDAAFRKDLHALALRYDAIIRNKDKGPVRPITAAPHAEAPPSVSSGSPVPSEASLVSDAVPPDVDSPRAEVVPPPVPSGSPTLSEISVASDAEPPAVALRAEVVPPPTPSAPPVPFVAEEETPPPSAPPYVSTAKPLVTDPEEAALLGNRVTRLYQHEPGFVALLDQAKESPGAEHRLVETAAMLAALFSEPIAHQEREVIVRHLLDNRPLPDTLREDLGRLQAKALDWNEDSYKAFLHGLTEEL